MNTAVRSDQVDARAAGGILVDLGGQVRDLVSTEIGRDVSGRLETLAGLLDREGHRLAGDGG